MSELVPLGHADGGAAIEELLMHTHTVHDAAWSMHYARGHVVVFVFVFVEITVQQRMRDRRGTQCSSSSAEKTGKHR